MYGLLIGSVRHWYNCCRPVARNIFLANCFVFNDVRVRLGHVCLSVHLLFPKSFIFWRKPSKTHAGGSFKISVCDVLCLWAFAAAHQHVHLTVLKFLKVEIIQSYFGVKGDQ